MLKKIGIMSMQRVKNYGSFLQAFALRGILENITNLEIDFVDFDTKQGIYDAAQQSYETLKSNTVKFISTLLIYKICKKLVRLGKIQNKRIVAIVNLFEFYDLYCRRFEHEFWKELRLNKENLRPELDMLVIGSDEVFNYVEAKKAGYSEELFGYGNNAIHIISFAGSFGCTRIEDLEKMGCVQKLRKYLFDFDAISVRDYNSREIVQNIIGEISPCHLDPVLHFDFSEFMPYVPNERPYLAVYAYSGISKEYREVIEQYARENELEILCFMGYQSEFGRFMNVSPFELLTYMMNAKCVVTTTFHGSVFSIKYNKKFCAIVQRRAGTGYGNDEKLSDLLQRTNLLQHMIDKAELIPQTLDLEIDYKMVNEYVNETVQDGIEYLKKQIKKMNGKENR